MNGRRNAIVKKEITPILTVNYAKIPWFSVQRQPQISKAPSPEEGRDKLGNDSGLES